MKENYAAFLANKNCRGLLLASIVNRFGDSVDAVAFTWIVYGITGSAAWSAFIFALNVLPGVIIQPLAGAFVENKNKRGVVIFTHMLRAAVISAFVFLYHAGFATEWIMAAFTLIISTIEAFNLPASSALFAQSVDQKLYSHGVSLNSSLSNAASLAGTGCAGIIIAAFGSEVAMLIDVATFIASSLIIFAMVSSAEKIDSQQTQNENYISVLKDGIKYISKSRLLIRFCVLAALLNLFLIPVNSLFAPIVSEIFCMDSTFLGFFSMMFSVGAILGSLLLPVLLKKFSPSLIVPLSGLVMGFGCSLIVLGNFVQHQIIPCYLLAFFSASLMSLCAALIGGILQIQFIKETDKSYLARCSSVFNASASAAMPIGSLAVSALSLHASVSSILFVCSIFIILMFIGIMIMHLDFGGERRAANA